MYGGVVGLREAARQLQVKTGNVSSFTFDNVVPETQEYYEKYLRKLALQFFAWRKSLPETATLRGRSMFDQFEAWWNRRGPLNIESSESRSRLRGDLLVHVASLVDAPAVEKTDA